VVVAARSTGGAVMANFAASAEAVYSGEEISDNLSHSLESVIATVFNHVQNLAVKSYLHFQLPTPK